MRRIAEKIEYSPTAIYLYFKDKEEILFHLVEEGFALLSAPLEALKLPDPIERLRQGGHAYLNFALSQPHYYKLMFQFENRELSEACAAQTEMGQRAFGFILTSVREAIAQGKFVSTEHEMVIAHTIWAHIHGAASLILAGRLVKMPPEAHHAFYDMVIDTTLRGLCSQA